MRTHPRRRLTRHFPIFPSGVVFLCLCYGVLSAEAQDLFWRASVVDGFTNNGDWFTAANWSPAPGPSLVPGRVPTAADSAAVNNNGPGSITPAATVGAPGAQARFLIIGGSQPDANNAGAPFSGAAGQAVVTGPTASLLLGQQATARPTFSLDVVNGSLTVENGGTLETTNTRVGTFQTRPTAGIEVAAQLVPTAPAFIDITGAGSNWIEHGTLEIGADESAQVVIQNGASFTGSGTVTIDAAGELDIGGGTTIGTFATAGGITNTGVINFNFTNALTLSNPISGIGTISMLGTGTLTLAADNSGFTGSISVSNGGTLIAAATNALGTGLVTVNDPSLLRIDPGVTINNFIQLNNGGTLDNAGTVQVTAVTPPPLAAVTTSGGATITNEAGATISGVGLIGIQSLTGPATVTNMGSISGVEGIELNGGGTITNNAGGTITGTDGAAIAAPSAPTGAPATAPATTPGPVTVVNSGTITGATSGVMLAGGGSVINNAGGRITGAAGAFQATSGTVNNAGSISGAPGINLAAGGTVTNTATGKVTGTGGTAAVIGGSQARLSNAGQISGDVQLNAASNTAQLFTGGKISGNLTLNPTGTNQVILDGSGIQLLSQSVTGTISNAGSLTKQGTGEWILDKSLSPPVSALISSGLLQINSGQTLTSPTVTVGPGGELSGVGTIVGSVINNGLVTPGDAPGTLTVTGNYTQGPSGVLNIQFASGSHGLLAVGGSAFLGGALRLSLVGGFVPPPAQSFTILTAGGGVNGVFGTVQQPGTATVFTVFYEPADVRVLVEQVPFQNFACNPNTRSVATALQSVRNTATGDLGQVIGVLNGLPTSELCNAFGQISPLPVPSLPTQVINTLDNASIWQDQRLWFLEQPFDPQHQWNVYVDGGGTFGRIENIFDLPALDFDTG
jgi:T5SS/PEP-CTERM-associated repeat protein